MISRTKFFTLIALLVLIIGAPVFAQDETTPAPDAAIEFNITMTDYNFVVDGLEANQPLQLEAGQAYRLHVMNNSTTMMAHEVLMGRNANTLEGGFKHDYAEPMLSDVEVVLTSQMDGKDFLIGVAGLNEFELSVGQEMTLEFTLPDDKVGDWEIGCFEFLSMENTEENPGPTHYDVGMHLPIEVSAANS